MCYSAQIWADYKKFTRQFGAILSVGDFTRIFWERREGGSPKIPKAIELAFAEPRDEFEAQVKQMIDEAREAELGRTDERIAIQQEKIAEAEAALQKRVTKKSQEIIRVANNRIAAERLKAEKLQRTDPAEDDDRIWPGDYTLVMVQEDGRKVIKPMRYQCRLPGWSLADEKSKPGTYNARRDSLRTGWRKLYGHNHGIMVATHFYESVRVHDYEHRVLADGERQQSVELEFTPQSGEPMYIPVLWFRWTDGVEELLSCGAITDEPEPEVAMTGHDRTIINIKPEHIDAWLNPDPKNLAALDWILEDKQHPFYEHKVAA